MGRESFVVVAAVKREGLEKNELFSINRGNLCSPVFEFGLFGLAWHVVVVFV